MVKLFERYIELREDMDNIRYERGDDEGIMVRNDVLALKYQTADRHADDAAEEIFETLRTLDELGGIEKVQTTVRVEVGAGGR